MYKIQSGLKIDRSVTELTKCVSGIFIKAGTPIPQSNGKSLVIHVKF
jgi:hypothetical protein